MKKKIILLTTITILIIYLITTNIHNQNKNKLVEIINQYNIRNNNYIPITIENFDDNYSYAISTTNSLFISKNKITEISNDLESSYNNLKIKPNKDKLFEKYQKYSKYDLSQYTKISVKRYTNILKTVKQILLNENSTIKDVHYAQKKLNEIDNILLYKKDIDILKQIEIYLRNTNKKLYLTKTIYFVDEAILNIMNLLPEENTTNIELNYLISTYTEQINNMILKGDKTNLNNLINKINKLDAKKYTTESYQNLENTLLEIKDIIEGDEYTQEEVDEAYIKLKKSYKSLEKKVKGTFKIYIYYSMLSNNSVGNEWITSTYYKEKEIYSGKKITGYLNSEIEVETEIVENDIYPDYDYEYVKLKLKNYYKISEKLRIRENRGRYTGNISEWKVTYIVKRIY